ncbi:hypothetical protein VitviT2T_014112 [Vitis vinifera]|uniref:Reverse transcriptase Ty1/copia-type domain-containing protein n=1 Tax=Vitis vinifera TaxID=29760 RepID=A0ABY9CLD0_VITVI|nr:hypothetical protein VitviT2T_014112 [Vitis vinifera]
MHEETKSFHKNNTYELMKLPKGKRALKNKWVLRWKPGPNRSQPRYKARLVVKGFSQKKCNDFEEIFSPMVKMSSIRVVLGLVANMNLEIEQLDVKTIFLHGDLEKEIYMEKPKGFTIKGKEHLVCRLKKSSYGLKQAPRQWFLSNPGKDHWAVMKWILRYLRGTSKTCLCFETDKLVLVGCTNADMARDVDSKKSTSGYFITFSWGAVSWQSKL